MGSDPRPEDRENGMRTVRRLRTPLHGPAEVPALADSDQKGASVGGATSDSRSLNRGVINTSFLAVTITASTFGRRRTSAIPFSGPSRNTPVDNPSARTAVVVRIVTLRHPACDGAPVSGSMM